MYIIKNMLEPTLRYQRIKVKNKNYIYLSISNGRGKENRYRTYPSVTVNKAENWKQDSQKIKVTPTEPNAKSYNDKLYAYKAHFIEELKECYKNEIRLDKDVIKTIEKSFGNSVTNKKIKVSNDKFDIETHYNKFIELISLGKKLHGNSYTYSANAISNHRVALKRWLEFENKWEGGKINPHNIDYAMYEDYLHYYRNHPEVKYKDSAISKNVACFKAVIKNYLIKDLRIKFLFYNASDWKIIEQEAISFALTETELLRLYKLDLSDNKEYELVRDVFVFNALTCGMRNVDYNKLNKEDLEVFKYKGKNRYKINFRQQKTGGDVNVIIPLSAEAILQKYDFDFPKYESEARANEVLKILGKKAKLFGKLQAKDRRGNVIEEDVQWNKLTLHISRKTFCTMAYKNDVDLYNIMNISGHESMESLLGYIKVNKEDYAVKYAETEHFEKLDRLHLQIA